jgi:D-alanyl-D-alanine carboxypeptidase (penicillin-binding protein 5/6)
VRANAKTTAVLGAGVALALATAGLGVSALIGGGPGRAREAAKTVSRSPAPRVVVPTGLAKRQVGGSLLARRGIVVRYRPGSRRSLPRVPASAYVIANARTGRVIAAKDPHGLFPPASTLKVLTAVTMLPRLNAHAMVLATKLAASVEPNIVGLIPGHRYRVDDLFRALLLISANDAAVSLVQASGSFATGMTLMNAEARHLQAYDVVAKQPNGLPAPGQVVSAYDLALIARQALAMPAFMRYDETLRATFPLRRHHDVALINQNYLLTQYRGGIGGKIGWTVKAEATYIGMARRHGVTLIVTIMHATPLTEITSAEKLLDWGFAMNRQVRPVGVLVPPLPARAVISAHHARAVKPAAAAHHAAGAATGSRTGSGTGLHIGIGHIPLADGAVTAFWAACVVSALVWLRKRRRRRRA